MMYDYMSHFKVVDMIQTLNRHENLKFERNRLQQSTDVESLRFHYHNYWRVTI